MHSWIALFRGINVGGKNILPMATLKRLLESLHCTKVSTYIQSGNVVFASAAKSRANLSSKLLDAVEREVSFRPKVILLTAAEFSDAKTRNPFPMATSTPKSLHFFFLDSNPVSPDLSAIAKLATDTEEFKLIDRVFYLCAPDGFGNSKLAASAERKLGVAATARNYATVEKIGEMAEKI